MPMCHRSSSPELSPQVGAPRRQRRPAPSCRGGASSMLRLAVPAKPLQAQLSGWLGRATKTWSPAAAAVLQLGAGDFAPSRWLPGH